MPSPSRLPTCFAVKTGHTFLFDCGEGAQRQMMKYTISYAKVKAIFFSHLHADHILGIFGLVQSLNLAGRKDELLLFGPKGLKEVVGSVLSTRFLRPDFPIRFTEVSSAKKVYEDALVKVSSFKVRHNVDALGYVLEEQPIHKFYEEKAKGLGIRGRLFREIQEKGFVTVNGKKITLEEVTFLKEGKRLVYSGDTLPCSSTEKAAHEADVLIHESTFSETDVKQAKLKFHSTARQAAELAKKAKAKKLVLVHFSNRYSDLQVLLKEAQEVFPETELAEEGKELLI